MGGAVPQRFKIVTFLGWLFLAGCVPPSFDKIPAIGPAPQPSEIVQHITCELASIVQVASGYDADGHVTAVDLLQEEKRNSDLLKLKDEMTENNDFKDLVLRLVTNRFVAAGTLTLFVTDI
jgi:hypothetical protein